MTINKITDEEHQAVMQMTAGLLSDPGCEAHHFIDFLRKLGRYVFANQNQRSKGFKEYVVIGAAFDDRFSVEDLVEILAIIDGE